MKKKLALYLFLILTVVSCKLFVLTDRESENIAVEQSNSESTEISSIIEPYKEKLEVSMNQIIGYSEIEMSTGSPEGLLGNYVSDLSLRIGNQYYSALFNDTADFALLNNGGLRTFLPKGEITQGKVFEIMPFENELVVVTLSVKKMVELFNYIGKKTVKGGNRKQGVPVSGNVKIELSGETPVEVLVDNMRLRGRPYKVITTDYLANGGDNMDFFLNPIKYEKLGIKLRDAIMNDVKSKKLLDIKVGSKLDKRISYVE